MSTPDNVLAYVDQSFFLDHRSLGQGAMIQLVWIYEHDVDLAALQRVQHNLGKGLLGRCIERSPLPFGRPRWVSWSPPAELDIAPAKRPRSEITEWLDEQTAKPISPESGPPWRLAVLPLAEGGWVVSLLCTHVLADGVGLANSVANAVHGTGVDLGYPPPRSRTKFKALLEDSWQSLRDLPQVIKGFALSPLAAREVPLRLRPAAQIGHGRENRPPAQLTAGPSGVPRLPSVAVLVDTPLWDQVAESMGGTSNSLLIGFGSRLCALLGWLDSDGLADLMIPVNERTDGDTRGNALTSAALFIDPATATDLQGIRAAVKAALIKLTAARDRLVAPLALVPLVPNFLARRFQTVLQKSASITVSHFGDLDPSVNRLDGTDAEWFFGRHARTPDMADPAFLRRVGGIFYPIASGRLGGHIYICVCHTDAESSVTTDRLREVVGQALDEFGLTATIV